MKKNYYHINFKIQCCRFEFRINDIPIFIEHEGRSLFAEIPINQLLREGKNNFTAMIRPEQNKIELTDELLFEFGVTVGKISPEGVDVLELFNINVRELYALDDITKYGIIHTIEFELSHNNYIPNWNNNSSIHVNEIEIKKIFKFYNDFYNIILDKNINAIRNILSDSARHISMAFYLNPEEKLESMVEAYKEILNDSDFKLQPLQVKRQFIQLYSYGKLIELLNDKNHSVIYFLNKEQTFIKNIPLKISRNEKNEYYICLT